VIILGLILLLLVLPHSAQAHNGAMAIAGSVEGITIDGDLSDWPEGMREYPIELAAYGVAPRDSTDFQGSFRIGYNPEEYLFTGYSNALLRVAQSSRRPG